MKLRYLVPFILVLPLPAQQWSTINADVLTSMNTSTPGTALTAAIGQAGTVTGTNCSATSTCKWSSVQTGFTVGAFQNACSNLGPVQMNGGTLYAAQTLNYNNVGHNDQFNNNDFTMDFSGTPGTKQHVRFVTCMTLGPPFQSLSGSDFDTQIVFDVTGHYAVWPQFNNLCPGSNQYGARMEGQPTAHSPCMAMAPQGTYWFAGDYDPTNGEMSGYAYTAQGTFMGVVSMIAGAFGPNGLFSYVIGNNEGGNSTGTTTYWQDSMLDFTSTFPTGSAATVTNGSATVTGLTGCGTTWPVPSSIFLPNSSDSINYYVAFCNSATSGNLNIPYSGTTVTGTAAWEVQPPLFWQNQSLAAGVVAPGRFTNWTPGVVGDIPTNRTQCTNTQCATVTSAGASATSAQINAAIANAPANTYVLLAAGTYSSATSGFTFGGVSNVTLRGAGANQTFLAPTSTSGGGSILVGTTSNNATSPQNGPVAVTGSTVQGSTTITLASVPNLVIGNPIILDELDPTADNGGIFVNGTGSTYTPAALASPGLAGPYNTIGGGNGIRGGSGCSSSPTGCYHQQEIVEVVSCNGVTTIGTACTGTNVVVGIFPGLHMPNWSTTNMFAWWATHPSLGDGVEDLSIDSTNNSGAIGIVLANCQGCWVKGVRSSNTSESHVQFLYSNLDTVRNNYFFGTQNAAPVSYGVEHFSGSNNLTENNIIQAVTTPMICNGPCSGSVNGYNYCVNGYYTSAANYSIPAIGGHAGGTNTLLNEGNVCDGTTEDVIHGTANMMTYFRNSFSVQPACWISGSSYLSATYGPCTSGITVMQIYSLHRFSNVIGNIVGSSQITNYCNGHNGSGSQCSLGFTANNTNAFGIGYGNGSVGNDSNTVTTTMLWANANSATGFTSPRFNCAETPTFPVQGTGTASMFLVQLPFLNGCPATQALPPSFYYASQPAWMNNGPLGAKPWPLIGPDVTGGNVGTTTGTTFSHGPTLATSSAQVGGATLTPYGNGGVNSPPAMDCALNTMGISPDGTSAEAPFNEATCYSGNIVPTQSTGQGITLNGATLE